MVDDHRDGRGGEQHDADHGKFGVQLFEVVCPLPRLTALVTGREPPPDLGAALEACGVSVLVAG